MYLKKKTTATKNIHGTCSILESSPNITFSLLCLLLHVKVYKHLLAHPLPLLQPTPSHFSRASSFPGGQPNKNCRRQAGLQWNKWISKPRIKISGGELQIPYSPILPDKLHRGAKEVLERNFQDLLMERCWWTKQRGSLVGEEKIMSRIICVFHAANFCFLDTTSLKSKLSIYCSTPTLPPGKCFLFHTFLLN